MSNERTFTRAVAVNVNWPIVHFRESLDLKVVAVHTVKALSPHVRLNCFGHVLRKVV
jgi:hypothetical protein